MVVVTPTVVDPLTDTAVPAQPEFPIPTLNTDSYDKSLGKDGNPHPAAPPLNPNHPPFGGNQVTPAVPSAVPSDRARQRLCSGCGSRGGPSARSGFVAGAGCDHYSGCD